MKICCLGWGSLIWDPHELPKCSDWHKDGPLLPVEFARQSSDGRITLVVAPGANDLPVLWAELDLETVEAARNILARREGIPPKFIDSLVGYWAADGSQSDHKHSKAIGTWAKNKGVSGVVWTALKPKISDDYWVPTSEEVIAYLVGLEDASKAKAEEYVRKTPPQIQTEYRAVIAARPGWY